MSGIEQSFPEKKGYGVEGGLNEFTVQERYIKEWAKRKGLMADKNHDDGVLSWINNEMAEKFRLYLNDHDLKSMDTDDSEEQQRILDEIAAITIH